MFLRRRIPGFCCLKTPGENLMYLDDWKANHNQLDNIPVLAGSI